MTAQASDPTAGDPADDPAALHHDPRYFASMYDRHEDPWDFDGSWYERRKFGVTLASLQSPHYGTIFEPGCANGALTAMLAGRCDRLVATELLPAVAERARLRLRDRGHVTVECRAFPAWWPDGPIDLLVLSEIGYYLHDAGRRVAVAAMRDALADGGEVVAVHYTGRTDYPMRGADVSRWLDGLHDLERTVQHDDVDFELGVWRRRS